MRSLTARPGNCYRHIPLRRAQGSLVGRLRGRRTLRLVRSGIPADIEGPGREGKAGAACFHDLHDAQQNVLLRLQEGLEGGLENVGEDLEVERRVFEPDEAQAGRSLLHLGMAEEHRPDLREDPAKLIPRGFRAELDPVIEEDLVPQGEVFHAHRRQLAVGDEDDRPVERPQPCRPQADILHGPPVIAGAAEIPHADRLVGDEHDSAEEVLKGFLGGKGDGDAAHAETGEHRCEVDSGNIEDDPGSHHHDETFGELADESRRGDPAR